MPAPFIPFVIAWGWMLLVLLSSVLYRKRAGKPIWAADEPGALFVEARASGASRRRWWTRFGGARNALYSPSRRRPSSRGRISRST